MKKSVKLYLVVRTDLGLSEGKLAAQSAHAALKYIRTKGSFHQGDLTEDEAFHLYDNDPEFKEFMTTYGNSPVIVVKRVKSEHKLLNLYEKAKAAGLRTGLQRDLGLNEVDPDTPTVLAIGPNYVEDCEPIVKRLQNL